MPALRNRLSSCNFVAQVVAVPAKVPQGVEIVVEQNHRTVAFIKPSKPEGRMISEVIADLKRRGSNAMIDDDFARDIEEGIKARDVDRGN